MAKYDKFKVMQCIPGQCSWFLSDGISLYLDKGGDIKHAKPHFYESEANAVFALARFKAENAAIDLTSNVYAIRYQGMICTLFLAPHGWAFVDTDQEQGRRPSSQHYVSDTAEQCVDAAQEAGYKVSVLPVSSDWG